MSEASTPSLNAAADIAALRARGAPRLDALRFAHIEALARRAAAHKGTARQVLDARLHQLIAACGQAVDAVEAASVPQATAAITAKQSAMADLLDHIAQASQTGLPPAAVPGATPTSARSAAASARAITPRAPTELKAVRAHRATWSRLRVDQQMNKAQALVPGNAGPLNTQRLVLQALQSMRAASPEYTQRFMAQVESLLWLDQANPVAGLAPAETPRSTPKKPAGRRGR
jgi:predicted NBD/HSP70 family sugar kinase